MAGAVGAKEEVQREEREREGKLTDSGERMKGSRRRKAKRYGRERGGKESVDTERRDQWIKQRASLHGQKYMDTWTLRQRETVGHLNPKPCALLCCHTATVHAFPGRLHSRFAPICTDSTDSNLLIAEK